MTLPEIDTMGLPKFGLEHVMEHTKQIALLVMVY